MMGRRSVGLGTRAELRADNDECRTCGLPLTASWPEVDRIAGPLVRDDGTVGRGHVDLLFGECPCGTGWGLVLEVSP